MKDTRYKIQDERYKMKDTRYKIPDTSRRIFHISYFMSSRRGVHSEKQPSLSAGEE